MFLYKKRRRNFLRQAKTNKKIAKLFRFDETFLYHKNSSLEKFQTSSECKFTTVFFFLCVRST